MKKRLWMIVILAISSTLLLQTPLFSLTGDEQFASVEERRILAAIQERNERLSERQEQLERRELQLKTLEAEVDKKIAAMQRLRTELSELLDRRDAEENARIEELSLIYERMNPQQAAVLISELETQLAVNLLLGIKKKTAGQIMERLNAETAIKLSKAFTDLSVDETAGN
jgi:flagellar motility protein MotE (MotC chaperone)